MSTNVRGDSINPSQTGNRNDKNLNGLDQLVAELKPDDLDDENIIDEEEREYQELISNKSGNFEFHLAKLLQSNIFLFCCIVCSQRNVYWSSM